jgi:hypothetical protein
MKRTILGSLGIALLLPAAGAAQSPTPKRTERAAALPLFATREALQLVLTADFRTVSRDRDTLSTKRYPARLQVVQDGSDTLSLNVQLRTRGHYRLASRNCPFVPLRVEFARDSVAKTPFQGQRGLKLVTHCRNEERYEQSVLREELVYRLHNLVTPFSFRSRLATVTYRDTTGKLLGKFPAFFVEDERDVARRNDGKIAELKGALFDDLDPMESTRFALFEYMIGNTDFSIYALHNVRLIVSEAQRYSPVAYDFDFSGLVGAHYATPDPRLGIKDVRTRLYRGGCSQVEQVPAIATEFLTLKPSLIAVYDSAQGLNKGSLGDAKYYLNEFFATLSNPRELKSQIIDRCVKNPGV